MGRYSDCIQYSCPSRLPAYCILHNIPYYKMYAKATAEGNSLSLYLSFQTTDYWLEFSQQSNLNAGQQLEDITQRGCGISINVASSEQVQRQSQNLLQLSLLWGRSNPGYLLEIKASSNNCSKSRICNKKQRKKCSCIKFIEIGLLDCPYQNQTKLNFSNLKLCFTAKKKNKSIMHEQILNDLNLFAGL